MIIHLVPTYKEYPEQIKDYKIVGVVTDQDLDCYFPLSMDPYASFSVGTFLMGETTLENLNKQLKQTTWQRGELNVYAYASLNAARMMICKETSPCCFSALSVLLSCCRDLSIS